MTLTELLPTINAASWLLSSVEEKEFKTRLGDSIEYDTVYKCLYPSKIEISVRLPYLSSDLLEELRYYWDEHPGVVDGWNVPKNPLPQKFLEAVTDTVEKRIVGSENQRTEVRSSLGIWSRPAEGPNIAPRRNGYVYVDTMTYKRKNEQFVLTIPVRVELSKDWHTSWDESWSWKRRKR